MEKQNDFIGDANTRVVRKLEKKKKEKKLPLDSTCMI